MLESNARMQVYLILCCVVFDKIKNLFNILTHPNLNAERQAVETKIHFSNIKILMRL